MIKRLNKRIINKKIILGSGDEWPNKPNSEYERLFRWDGLCSPKSDIPKEIACDIRDIIAPKYKEIKSEYGEPRNLYIPNRFESQVFDSESVYNSYRGGYTADYSQVLYFGMSVLFHDGEELYIEYLPEEDVSKYIANFDA
jgi:hypothetical protein